MITERSEAPRVRRLQLRARLLVTAGSCLVLGSACSANGGSRSLADVKVEFVRERHGGLCPGPDGGGAVCRYQVVVLDDGTWSATGTTPSGPTGGRVRVGAASELAGLVDREWKALTAHAFTGLCPTAYDGSEVVYTVRRIPQGEAAAFADAEIRELASCTYDLGHPDAHAAILRLRELWRALDLPE